MSQFVWGILLGMAMMSIGSPAHANEPLPVENCAGGPPCPWTGAPAPPPPEGQPELPPRSCPGDGRADPTQSSPGRAPLPPTVTVVEYQSDQGSYFYTIDVDEMALLDNGGIRGWRRTGRTFAAYGLPHASLEPVFRLWMPGKGHVFTHDTAKVAEVWYSHGAQWEGIAFFVPR